MVQTVLWVLVGCASVGAAVVVAWFLAGQREFERLYGRGTGRLRLRLPRRRVPGLPLDGRWLLTGEDDAAIAAMELEFARSRKMRDRQG
jgi:hypothetical protein